MLEVQAEAAKVLRERLKERRLPVAQEARAPVIIEPPSAIPQPPVAASSELLERKLQQLSLDRQLQQPSSRLAALPADMLHAILAHLGTRSLATAAVVWPIAVAAVARARVQSARPGLASSVVPRLRSCAALEELEAAVGPCPADRSWRDEYVPLRLRLAIASPLKHPAAVAGVDAWAKMVMPRTPHPTRLNNAHTSPTSRRPSNPTVAALRSRWAALDRKCTGSRSCVRRL